LEFECPSKTLEVFLSDIFEVASFLEGFTAQKRKRTLKSCFDWVDSLNCRTLASIVCNFKNEVAKMETKGRGFSVIEILIVMGVLGVIAAVFTI
jgi:prepilin-type N-terminal cleavage/methylation domain-containing protein